MRSQLCFSFPRLQVHIFAAASLNHTLDLSSCPDRQYVCGDLTNPGGDKMSENKQTFRLFRLCFFLFFFSLSLFVFPPSSGLTPSRSAVSASERKSQIGTSRRKSCCPAPTVGAAVSSCRHQIKYPVVFDKRGPRLESKHVHTRQNVEQIQLMNVISQIKHSII